MNQQGFTTFKRQLKRALIDDFATLFHLIGAEKIYGISLVSDSFIESLQLMINSEESLLIEINKYEERLGEIDSEDYRKLRWRPSLWHYSNANIQHPQLLTINQYLYNKNVEDFATFELEFYGALIEVMQTLDQEGLFSESIKRDDITLFISIANDDRASVFENYSANELNSTSIYEAFLLRNEGD